MADTSSKVTDFTDIDTCITTYGLLIFLNHGYPKLVIQYNVHITSRKDNTLNC